MILKDDYIQNANDIRYDALSLKYQELSEKLSQLSRQDEEKHKAMLESFEIVNKRILDSASNLARKPIETEEQEPESRSERSERSSLRKKLTRKELYDQNRFWIVEKHGL
jgi:ATP-dependent protease HslVU (ClpYQ) ATPase subunit